MSPLAKDLSSLPRPARAQGSGLMPDAEPRYVHTLVAAWRAADANHDSGKHRGRLYFSSAGKCARALSYQAAGIPRSDPMDLAGTWNVNLGEIVHRGWQESLQAAFPDAEVEVRVDLLDGDLAGRCDAVIRGERTVVIELKTIGGFGFKGSVGRMGRGKPAEGPRSEHILQAALGGLAVGADEIVVAYLAKECLSVSMAKGLPELARFSAEWTLTRDEYEPLAIAERDRMAGILKLADAGQLASRKVPDLPAHAEIVDPKTSRWEERDADGTVIDTGSLWNGQFCLYCSHFTLCSSTPSGRIPITSVEIRGAA